MATGMSAKVGSHSIDDFEQTQAVVNRSRQAQTPPTYWPAAPFAYRCKIALALTHPVAGAIEELRTNHRYLR